MRLLRAVARNLFRHRHVERDLDEEVRSHLELLVEQLCQGAGPENGRSVNLGRLLMFPIVSQSAKMEIPD
jgi:hypothetical protein